MDPPPHSSRCRGKPTKSFTAYITGSECLAWKMAFGAVILLLQFALSHVFEFGLPKECIWGFLTSCVQRQRSPVISNMSVKSGSPAKNTMSQSVHQLKYPYIAACAVFFLYLLAYQIYSLTFFFSLSLICTVTPSPSRTSLLFSSYQAV